MAIQVFAGGGVGNLQEKTITPSTIDITVVADEGYDALSKVTVLGDEDLIAENIKNGVSLWNVTGTANPTFYKIVELTPQNSQSPNYQCAITIPLGDFGDISSTASTIYIQPLFHTSAYQDKGVFVVLQKNSSWILTAHNFDSSTTLYGNAVTITGESVAFTLQSVYQPIRGAKGMYAVYIKTS